MKFTKILFVAIDKLFDRPQNERSFTQYKDINFLWEKDVVYRAEEPDCCTLDLCREDGKENYPVLLYIHGGGFVAGDKYYRRAISRWGAKCGCAVVNVNYGLSPEYKFPAQHVQLAAALNWVEQNAEKYSLDLSRVAIAGDSAGAYFAAVLACMANDENLQKFAGVNFNLKFSAAIFNSGIFDLTSLIKKHEPLGIFGELFKDVTGADEQSFENYRWKKLCCVQDLVNSEFPKSFFTFSKKDVFCKGQSEQFIKSLEQKGVVCESYSSAKFIDNHCFSINRNGKASKENNALVQDFLMRFIEGKQ